MNMPTCKRLLAKSLLVILSLASFAPLIHSQQTESQTQDRQPDVIRTTTELVQTEVMVFDKQGRFVDGLKPEQFELTLNGAKQPVSFFERVATGSQTEAAQLSAARGLQPAKKARNKVEPLPLDDQGRVLFFFLDDLHTSPASLSRARKALLRFVDNQMNPNDQVAIVSSSGQVGFLQQLTNNPAVLHAAIGRLNNKQVKEGYPGKTQISDYMASQIEDYRNKSLLAYLMEATKVEQQMGPGSRHGDHRAAASYSSLPFIENRINQINSQARIATVGTLDALKGLMLSSSALPGRKVVFFLSDGFLVSERRSGVVEALEAVTEAARRSGVIVYTMDVRGTVFTSGSAVDASSNDFADFSARKAGLAGEISATQEPLKRIAEETGGRAILNSNAITDGILQAIRETSEYYLLAWRPDSAEQRSGKQRLQVVVKDRPELRVRLRNNDYRSPFQTLAKASNHERAKSAGAISENTASGNPTSQQTVEQQLLRTLGSLYPEKALPVSVSVGYLNTGAGLVLRLSMQIDRAALDLDPEAKNQKAEVDVFGAAVDDRGQVVSFKQVLSVPEENTTREQLVVWNQQLNVKPGLYQVRVAVRERSSGRTGSALTWIDLPETVTTQFGLSSLFLGERKEDAPVITGVDAAPQAVHVDVDHHFARGSALRFQTYVYNAMRTGKDPEVSIETQVLRNREPVMRLAPVKLPLTRDAAQLPYWSEIGLKDLAPGHYVLLVTATDQLANRKATERVNFIVE
jgi:VWFA-related protein